MQFEKFKLQFNHQSNTCSYVYSGILSLATHQILQTQF